MKAIFVMMVAIFGLAQVYAADTVKKPTTDQGPAKGPKGTKSANKSYSA